MANILEQSFWFEGIRVDQQDYPADLPQYTNTVDNQSNIFDEYNLYDYAYGYKRYVYLSDLFKANTEQKWKNLLDIAEKCEAITIINDVKCENTELSFAESFYVNVFYSAIRKVNQNCYIYNTDVKS